MTIDTRPQWMPLLIDRRGLLVDGALVAPVQMEDDGFRARPTGLIIHSVEPGSTAEARGIAEQDELLSVDGQMIADIHGLRQYLATRDHAQPVRILLRRSSDQLRRWSDIHVRELPGANVQLIGGGDTQTAGVE